jgi:hypothetical protein
MVSLVSMFGPKDETKFSGFPQSAALSVGTGAKHPNRANHANPAAGEER